MGAFVSVGKGTVAVGRALDAASMWFALHARRPNAMHASRVAVLATMTQRPAQQDDSELGTSGWSVAALQPIS